MSLHSSYLRAAAICLAVLPACTGQVVETGGQDAGRKRDGARDVRLIVGDGPARKDQKVVPKPDWLTRVDAASKAGEPCTYGQCAGRLICMGGICEKMCKEPMPGCNYKTSECGANESCIWASTFTGACIKATAGYLQSCGSSAYCMQGNLCVRVGSNPAKCLRLCIYGCPAGVPCGKTDNGCDVCIQ